MTPARGDSDVFHPTRCLLPRRGAGGEGEKESEEQTAHGRSLKDRLPLPAAISFSKKSDAELAYSLALCSGGPKEVVDELEKKAMEAAKYFRSLAAV